MIVIMQPVAMAAHPGELSDPRLLPTRRHLFRRAQVPATQDQIAVVRDHVEARAVK
jgi:hypothetical protein